MSVIERAYFSGGCFWCTEAIYKRLNGVLGVKPGFSGGNIKIHLIKRFARGEQVMLKQSKLSMIPVKLISSFFWKCFLKLMIQQQ